MQSFAIDTVHRANELVDYGSNLYLMHDQRYAHGYAYVNESKTHNVLLIQFEFTPLGLTAIDASATS